MSNDLKSQMIDTVREAIHKGWTLEALAVAADIPQPVLYRFVNGETGSGNLATIQKLAAHFGMQLTAPKRNFKPPRRDESK